MPTTLSRRRNLKLSCNGYCYSPVTLAISFLTPLQVPAQLAQLLTKWDAVGSWSNWGSTVTRTLFPALKKVIDGEDAGGITKLVHWKGGGGFRYFHIAPSLLEQDKFGNWIISKQYNAAMLAEAMCKLEGFTYAPSETEYWNHGYSTEQDFHLMSLRRRSHASNLKS